eukprot:TRINITY_DN4886_c0_g4_i1.p1 TRINITY_DN4886_c0_g4~~TRINITY_DN4886_c0_g4_i1.p1  ORF type:complete len:551 (+),score=79.13 TRINITY_DN4886_c0_g4_i1:102-1754(+)
MVHRSPQRTTWLPPQLARVAQSTPHHSREVWDAIRCIKATRQRPVDSAGSGAPDAQLHGSQGAAPEHIAPSVPPAPDRVVDCEPPSAPGGSRLLPPALLAPGAELAVAAGAPSPAPEPPAPARPRARRRSAAGRRAQSPQKTGGSEPAPGCGAAAGAPAAAKGGGELRDADPPPQPSAPRVRRRRRARPAPASGTPPRPDNPTAVPIARPAAQPPVPPQQQSISFCCDGADGAPPTPRRPPIGWIEATSLGGIWLQQELRDLQPEQLLHIAEGPPRATRRRRRAEGLQSPTTPPQPPPNSPDRWERPRPAPPQAAHAAALAQAGTGGDMGRAAVSCSAAECARLAATELAEACDQGRAAADSGKRDVYLLSALPAFRYGRKQVQVPEFEAQLGRLLGPVLTLRALVLADLVRAHGMLAPPAAAPRLLAAAAIAAAGAEAGGGDGEGEESNPPLCPTLTAPLAAALGLSPSQLNAMADAVRGLLGPESCGVSPAQLRRFAGAIGASMERSSMPPEAAMGARRPQCGVGRMPGGREHLLSWIDGLPVAPEPL